MHTINRTERIVCNEDFANDLEDFFSATRDNLHNAVIGLRMREEGFD